MKNFVATLVLALAACGVGFGVFYVMSDEPGLRRAARDGDAMAWLRTEFRLDEIQFARIKKLHEDYSIACGRHCAAIMAARERQAPSAEVAVLEKTCVDSMTGHFRRVAAMMPAAEGQRYLATVMPRIAGYEHVGAPNLQVAP